MQFQLDGEHGLFPLAGPGPVAGQIQVSRQLLGDRARSLDDPHFPQIDQRGPGDAAEGEPEMVVKGLVLGGEGGQDQMPGNLPELDGIPVFPLSSWSIRFPRISYTLVVIGMSGGGRGRDLR